MKTGTHNFTQQYNFHTHKCSKKPTNQKPLATTIFITLIFKFQFYFVISFEPLAAVTDNWVLMHVFFSVKLQISNFLYHSVDTNFWHYHCCAIFIQFANCFIVLYQFIQVVVPLNPFLISIVVLLNNFILFPFIPSATTYYCFDSNHITVTYISFQFQLTIACC